MSASCETVSLEFGCSPEKVWSVFTDAERYSEWYGYPRTLEVVSAEPSFTAGGKLSFRGMRGTSVITAFVPCTNFAISSSSETNVFAIAPAESGCRVSLTTSLNADDGWRGTAAARSRANREILHRLRRAVGSESDPDIEPPQSAPEEPGRSSLFKTFLSGLLHGYKNPLARRSGGAQDSIDLANIIDNTEADVVIHRNASTAGFALAALLFAALSIAVRFPLVDVVPSSGLSVYNSEQVDKTHAEQLYIGQSKESVELSLSCAGTRLDANSYVYYSELGTSGGERIYAVYDAYGEARSLAYIDPVRANRVINPEITDLSEKLAAVTTIAEVESACGYELSSFKTDKSGVSVIRFGWLDTARGVFDELPTGELEITLSGGGHGAQAAYYAARDPENPFPATVWDDKLTRQYNNNSYYIADRAAYERLFLLLGLKREQANLLLGTEGVDYANLYAGAVICSYSARSAVSDEAQYRYRYDVTFNRAGEAYRASFRNRSLAQRDKVLLERSEYDLRDGMGLFELYGELGILPTYAELDAGKIVLGYGAASNEYEDRVLYCELTVELDAETRTVTDLAFRNRN